MKLRVLLARAISGWALLGGALLCLVILLNVLSVASAAFGAPTPGDFELTQMGVAVAVFTFLPYAQLTRANVSADIFTARASPRWITAFALLGSLTATLFGCLLIARMIPGMLDQKAYGYVTAILQFPHWIAFLPILASLGLLVAAAGLTLHDDIKGLR